MTDVHRIYIQLKVAILGRRVKRKEYIIIKVLKITS